MHSNWGPTNPLPPEAFAAFSFDPTVAATESAETESPEVTLRHDHDHLPQDTDHEILLNELFNLGCTETTLSILANNQVNRHFWLQILNTLTSIQGFYRVFGSIPVGRLPGTIKGPFKALRYCLKG